MSSHRRRIKHFSRKSGPRKALIRGLVVALVEHGRIKTTVDRAKEVRRHVEKAITLGKDADLA
ncbi:MAG TPA: L17 family ribosomal protein, partial [Pseudobdellovibrionaceae bacterium]|nr:L17 family ribosomal protein [Pseudobdellovibrionaceae bacterium]